MVFVGDDDGGQDEQVSLAYLDDNVVESGLEPPQQTSRARSRDRRKQYEDENGSPMLGAKKRLKRNNKKAMRKTKTKKLIS